MRLVPTDAPGPAAERVLDLAPLLAGRHDPCRCPLCGFPRTEHSTEWVGGDEVTYYSCDTCWNDVRRADRIRRKLIAPAWG
jgi:hypothetical protein